MGLGGGTNFTPLKDLGNNQDRWMVATQLIATVKQRTWKSNFPILKQKEPSKLSTPMSHSQFHHLTAYTETCMA